MHLGIDLGGTKTEIAALSGSGDILLRRRVASVRDDYLGTLGQIEGLVRETEQALGPASTLGIGIPGALSPRSGRVKNANSTWLIGQPLRRDLQQRLARPVVLANDADCFVLSEACLGAGRRQASVFGVILGTGVGGGLFIHDRLVQGPNALAGEWGHNPLPWRDASEPLPACYCGKHGCIETYLSGPAFSALHAHEHTEVPVPAPVIVERARSGDCKAAASLNRYLDRLARALAGVINIVDPELIILGGGMSNLDELYSQLPERLPRYVFGGECQTRIVRARHGDSSGVLGAAWLGKERC
jgi:fructokinase